MIIINISGPQGSGKTIAAGIIRAALEAQGKVVLTANSARDQKRLLTAPWKGIPEDQRGEVVCDVMIQDFG